MMLLGVKPMVDNKHHITITGIIIRDGKYLITKRSMNKRLFPGMWTVPGGNLETVDYINDDKDTSSHWYNVVEKVLRREIMEEVGLQVKNIKYLTNMTMMAGDNPLMIFSLYCDHHDGDVVLNDESVDHKWVSLEEAREHDLIEGIYDELVMLDKILKGDKVSEWKKK
jgi:8-oxo-dGTP pyrophosphatase MutT (NUDIX family)